ncbi:hypothetical protein [Nitrosovibrio sp. Nv6]|nr:hypothetical protein [Nitrosovibrio sp. Nv6]SEO43923.1 hypothetical protein SAMN05216316_0216 [Nitrosovibrio sp. Nv6]
MLLMARDAKGTVIQDAATDGNPEMEEAAAAIMGGNGSVEVMGSWKRR